MNLNARSVFFLTQKMLPLLQRRATAEDPSRVINTTSVLGSRPDPMMAYSYCASKAALEQMTRNQFQGGLTGAKIGRAHVRTPVT